MRPFDFVITFFSFIYSLALTHLLLAVAHMIRRRREIIFDWPHGLWMLAAFVILVANWISYWDYHVFATLPLATIAIGFAFSVNQYIVCALVAPRLGMEDGFDMHVFHQTQGRTYIASFVVLMIFSIIANYLSGTSMNLQNLVRENGLVVAMFCIAAAALVWRNQWLQVVAPCIFVMLTAAYLVTFYPVLR